MKKQKHNPIEDNEIFTIPTGLHWTGCVGIPIAVIYDPAPKDSSREDGIVGMDVADAYVCDGHLCLVVTDSEEENEMS